MSIFVSEQRKKVDRLLELQSYDFNVPRFFYLPKSSINLYRESLTWSLDIIKSSPSSIFNIRTYNYNPLSNKESISSPHITDISKESLADLILEYHQSYDLLIDSETPDNGRLAGNIVIHDDSKANPSFTFEFIIKEKRAMVRDINDSKDLISLSSKFQDASSSFSSLISLNNLSFSLPDFQSSPLKILLFILYKSFSFPRRDSILEFTFFNSPSGIFSLPDYSSKSFPESHIVFWEWRGF